MTNSQSPIIFRINFLLVQSDLINSVFIIVVQSGSNPIMAAIQAHLQKSTSKPHAAQLLPRK